MVITFFFFNDTATTEIYTLSLHDALPIWVPVWMSVVVIAVPVPSARCSRRPGGGPCRRRPTPGSPVIARRSEEHTSELQSRQYLVCRLLLEKKKTKKSNNPY